MRRTSSPSWGLTLVAAGQPAAAVANLAAAVRRFEQLGDRNAADTYQVVLGLAHRALGDLDLARASWQGAIRLSEPLARRLTGS
ncbi:hypothetical protein ACFY2R_26430 [Micromonospora olivasterospora]|uniref:Tetratricopeptide repeat protein n=1 Tax=Micromonospora olivasterospora TaxID=1880 RepID=A0A562IGE0_MICOL|nr:hypothetical protein [Micromonospora olivasterospora]TWH70079.1 hypothetical protein JD77_05099 [Micromonospora olivasterospora]